MLSLPGRPTKQFGPPTPVRCVRVGPLACSAGMWRGGVLWFGVMLLAGLAAASAPGDAVSPVDEWTCPASHPIKATYRPVTRQCVYHVPSGAHYRTARPDVCFATEEDARREECWRAEEVL